MALHNRKLLVDKCGQQHLYKILGLPEFIFKEIKNDWNIWYVIFISCLIQASNLPNKELEFVTFQRQLGHDMDTNSKVSFYCFILEIIQRYRF